MHEWIEGLISACRIEKWPGSENRATKNEYSAVFETFDGRLAQIYVFSVRFIAKERVANLAEDLGWKKWTKNNGFFILGLGPRRSRHAK